MSVSLVELFARTQSENRAALIAYIPAGFPSRSYCQNAIRALGAAGVDAIEIGFPYSDPVMDGPTIQAAAQIALQNGTGAREVFSALKVAVDCGVAGIVMTYWNPIEKYGVSRFAREMARNGGAGVITPDLTIEESREWRAETDKCEIDTIYVVAPSTSDARLERVTSACSGFIYAASLMGVTGARSSISSTALDLVSRIRKVSTLPIAVGLGVSTRAQAKEVAAFADGVIVGSAFIKLLLDASDEKSGLAAISKLAQELSLGVREGRA